MLRIRSSTEDVDIEGTAADLQQLRDQVLELALSARGEVTIQCEANYDPSPYGAALTTAVISVGLAPMMVEVVAGSQLHISGSPDNLRQLASFINIPADASEGWHAHYEYHGENPYISATAKPLVFSLRQLTTA